MRTEFRAAFALATLLQLAACGSLQVDSLQSNPPRIARRVEHTEVAFYAQEAYQCGPAALATAFSAAGRGISPDRLADEVFTPGREGSFQAEMLAAPRRHGLVAVPLPPRIDALLAEIAAGHSPIVLQNLAFNWYPRWHYAVVVGYDLDDRVVLLRSGTEPRQEIGLRTFENTWQRSGYWAMLVLPPGELPATVDPDTYARAVAELERSGFQDSARAAYARALQRWPDNLLASIGLGNTEYALRRLPQAISAFRHASDTHPDSAVAFNNLAQALADSGRNREAKAAAERAVSLGGPTSEVALRTLRSIEAGPTGKGQTNPR